MRKFLRWSVLFLMMLGLVSCAPRPESSDDLIVPGVSAAELETEEDPIVPAPAATVTDTVDTDAPVVSEPAAPITVTEVVTREVGVPTEVIVTRTVTVTVEVPGSAPVASVTVTGTYPALTMADVAPWIAKMGSGGHPGHDVVGNTQCAYWLDPKYLGFADDTGPNTSGVEQTEGVFRFDLAAIAKYKALPLETVFVAEAAWSSYKGSEYEQAFLVITDRDTIDLTGAAIFALPNPASVEPLLALRQAHLLCRGYEDSIVDFRSGAPVVKYTARAASDLDSAAATAIPSVPATTDVVASYKFGDAESSIEEDGCVELHGNSGNLIVLLMRGGFAVSGRVDDDTDWQIAKSSGAGTYNIATWTGWLLCFDSDPAKAEASLIATDGNAKNNARITWQPAK